MSDAPNESRRPHPQPMAAPFLEFDIARELEQLHGEPGWQSGHNGKTLVKYDRLRVVLIALRWDSGGATAALQDSLQRNKPDILASYALIGAILLLGGVGYGVDRWAGTSPWFLLIGLVAGILFGFYNLVSSVRSDAS
jgi:hypothetical protein